jgi:diguanylate cyclase (GGDEF)-like protein/PAS domain S-box-containing protein
VRTEHVLAAILSLSDDALISFSLDGKVRTWSRGAEALYGYTASEMVGEPLARLLPPCDAPMFDGLLHAAIRGEFPQFESAQRMHKNRDLLLLSIQRVPVRNECGELAGIVESGKAVGKPTGLGPGETRIADVIEQMPMIVWTTDRELRLTSCAGAGLRGARTRREEFLGKSVFEYLKCQDWHTTPITQHCEALRGTPSQFEYKRHNRVLELHLEPMRSASGEITGCIGAGLDITERKKTEEKMRYQATHDALTGLVNYREFLDTLECEVRRAERSNHAFAVLLLDLDALKSINDRLGHLAGNRALQRLAEIMKEQCRSTDLAARYGGDEFGVLLIDADPGMARHIARRVQGALAAAHEEPRLTVSIGVSVYPEDGRSAQELLESADQELYRRKRTVRPRGRGLPVRAR